jgi:hypothetical protein
MHLICIFLAPSAASDDVNYVGVGCEPVEVMVHCLGDKQTCSGVMAVVASADVVEDLAPSSDEMQRWKMPKTLWLYSSLSIMVKDLQRLWIM